MKQFLLFSIGLFLVGCGTEAPPITSNKNTAPSMMEAMKDMPCHYMSGMWMGDCDFDENGVPKTEKKKRHDGKDG